MQSVVFYFLCFFLSARETREESSGNLAAVEENGIEEETGEWRQRREKTGEENQLASRGDTHASRRSYQLH